VLTLACGISAQNIAPSFTRIALLLPVLVVRAGKLMIISEFTSQFVELLNHERMDVRTTIVVLLGESQDKKVTDILTERLEDWDGIVRNFAVPAQKIDDEKEGVRNAVEDGLKIMEWKPED
jgi:HEAT repeat protein